MLSCFILLWSFAVNWISFCALLEFAIISCPVFCWVVWCGVLLLWYVQFYSILSCVLLYFVLLWWADFYSVFYSVRFFCGFLLFCYFMIYSIQLLYCIISGVVFLKIFLLCCALFSVYSYFVLFLIANHCALVLHLRFDRL